ncbi:MAG: sensor histidine kinase [Chloroflexi bacterium]|nr:sensor histidine kinase [Chloroflexota bacterium]
MRTVDRIFAAGILFLVAAIFGVGLFVPLGIAQGVLYVAPVALSLWLPGRRYTVYIAVACGFLTVLGVFVSHPGSGPLSYAIVNRAYSLLAIGMLVLVDRLLAKLSSRNAELTFRTTTLEALYEISNALSSLHDLSTIKETAVRRAFQLLKGDIAGLALADDDSGLIRWQFLSGAASDRLRRDAQQSGDGLFGRIFQTGQPVVVEDAAAGGEETMAVRSWLDEISLRAALAVPVGVGGETIGVLMVGYRARRAFALNDVKLLAGLADQVAIAINNAQLYDRVRALSAMEERQRLAREMHDGLAQLLGNITAQATASAELLAQRRWDDAQQRLARLRQVAQMAYAEVRHAILGLRAASRGEHGFLKMLDEFAVQINQGEGLSIGVEVEPGINVGELAPPVEVQAVRIVQEALANVRKHSRATEALIKIRRDGGWLSITVEDNGRGFSLTEGQGDDSHLGLQIMRERAELVGGELRIETATGGGTAITVRLPVSEED